MAQELKWNWVYYPYLDAPNKQAESALKAGYIKVVIKDEADKVIAELKEKHKTEVKELLCLIRDKENNFNRAFDSEEKEIRHHKYKRCLAMTRWCDAEADVADADGDYEDMRWFQKWHKRWLELSEKFKEAK